LSGAATTTLAGGWTVEVVRLCETPDKRDGE
jgi:hypothetical protein